MRGRLAVVLLWCAATAGATTVVQAAVGTIRAATRRDTVVDVQAVAVDTVGSWTTTSAAGPVPPPASAAVPGTGSGAAGAGSAATGAGPVSPASGPAAPASTIVPGASTVPATPSPSTTSTSPAPAGAPIPTLAPAGAVATRTVSTRGGTATIRLRAGDVAVVAATPNAGYTAKVSQRGADAVRVEFERAESRSRIDAWWDTEPRVEVREE